MNPIYRVGLLPAVVIGLLFLLSLLQEEQTPPNGAGAPLAVLGDGDTTDETLNTLIAQVSALDNRIGSLRDYIDERTEALGDELRAYTNEHSAAERDAAIEARLRSQWQSLNRDVRERLDTLEQSFERRLSSEATVATDTLSLPVANPKPARRRAVRVPAGTIMFDAVALTALAGKVPRDGALESPFPVKVLVGEDNIAPGGKTIAGLKGMLLSGIAVGDATLMCVKVTLTHAHFPGLHNSFSGSRSATPLADAPAPLAHASNPHGVGQGAGWLSDPAGIPCVPGKLISAERTRRANSVLHAAALGLARGLQQSELSEIASVEGNVLRAISGDSDNYSAASALTAALEHGAERAFNRPPRTDVVYVAPGERVIVHIAQQLTLDYDETDKYVTRYPQDVYVDKVYPD